MPVHNFNHFTGKKKSNKKSKRKSKVKIAKIHQNKYENMKGGGRH